MSDGFPSGFLNYTLSERYFTMSFTNQTAFLQTARRLIVTAAAAGVLILAGCKSEVYQGLSETQANAMMAVLLKNGIVPEKTSAKNGYTLAVESDQVVQTLELMRENNLPRSDYETMGQVFSAKGMISSSTEEQARLTYALSQELSDTFSRIDGVLTARVHVVLESKDLASGRTTPASAAVFLRHTPDSQAPHLVPRIKELTANAVAGLNKDDVSVMLVPVRDTVTVPMPQGTAGSENTFVGGKTLLLASALLFLIALGATAAAGLLYFRSRRSRALDNPLKS